MWKEVVVALCEVPPTAYLEGLSKTMKILT
jgi:hypothetical protein